ncbi:MAG: hypothetical protein AB7Y46_14475 [Armatimonadota bacterium]
MGVAWQAVSRRARAHPAGVIWALAVVGSLPGLWHLPPSFSEDPDMVHQAPTLMAYEVRDLPKLFTETAPWGDGSYRPIVFLVWWLEGRAWGYDAGGWGFTSWLMGVVSAALLGLLTLRISGRAGAATAATALVALNQSVASPFASGWPPQFPGLLVLLTLVWLVLLPRNPAAGAVLGRVVSGLGLLWVVGNIELAEQTWVPSYVGGRVGLQGAMLHVLAAYVAFGYADTGRLRLLACFWVIWAAMALSYEQPLCLPLAAAPAFLIAVPKRHWRRGVPLLLGAAVLTAGYLLVRWHFLEQQWLASYQVSQWRSGTVWLHDLLEYAFPPACLVRAAGVYVSPIALLVLSNPFWFHIGCAIAWFWAYAGPLRRDRSVQVWYFWRVIAYLPLMLFHAHSHYSYLPQLATAATHGLLLHGWMTSVRRAAPSAMVREDVDRVEAAGGRAVEPERISADDAAHSPAAPDPGR